MKLKPRCGCVILVLALLNMIGFLIAIILSFVSLEDPNTGNVLSPIVSVPLLLLFLANAIVCVAVGWGAVRAGVLRLPTLLEGEEE